MVDQKELVDAIKETISREDVRYIVGYEKGTYGFETTPSFAYNPEDAEKFIFNPLCTKNLAVYPILEEKLPLKRDEQEDTRKIGVVVRGCDSRAVVQLLQEKGLARDNLVLIGVTCPGVINIKKLKEKFPNQTEYTDVKEEKEQYIFTIDNSVQKIPKEELLANVCKECAYPNPVIYDILIGDEVEVATEQIYSDVREFEEKTLSERWEFWEKHFENCIRCYACREACPLCYCKTCMADLLDPQWIRRSVNLSENTAWNIMRAFHLAGRCVSCGECERACPAEIPLMKLNKMLEKEIKELYYYTAGMDPEEKTLFGTFNPDDPEEFIM